MAPILSKYIYRQTHKDWRKEERLGKQRKEKPKAEKQRKRREREASQGGTDRFLPAPGLPHLHHLPRRTTWEQSRGSRPGGRRGRCPEELRGATPNSPGPPTHPPPKPPVPRPATYFWSIPAGRAPAGRAGQRPRPGAWWQLAPRALCVHQHAAMPAP